MLAILPCSVRSILACSERKKSFDGLVPAIQLYDGPTFRVLRKFIRGADDLVPTVLILSAKHGLIEAGTRIRTYDVRMNPSRAERMRRRVQERLADIMRSSEIQSVGVCLGRDYRRAIDGFESVAGNVVIDVLGGGLGKRLRNLRDWLHRDVSSKSDERRSKKRAYRPTGRHIQKPGL